MVTVTVHRRGSVGRRYARLVTAAVARRFRAIPRQLRRRRTLRASAGQIL